MLKRFTLLAGGAMVVLLTGCTPAAEKSASDSAAMSVPAEPNVAEIKASIEAANQKWAAAMMAGDVSTALGNYSDDAVVMMPMMPTMNGRAAYEAGFKDWLGMVKVNEAKPTTLDIMVGGDLAVETGTFSMTSTMKDAKPVTEIGKYLTVWKRQADGSWKIVRDINNADGPAAATK